MIGWPVWALAGIFLVYVAIAVFRGAYAALSPVAVRRILAGEGPRREAAGTEALGVRMAFDVAHHLTLIAGAILLLAALEPSGIRRPYLVGGLLLVSATLAAQLAGRALAALNPERAFTALWRVAYMLYHPFHPAARPFLSALERLRLASRRELVEDEPEAAAEEIEALIDVGRSEGLLEVEEGRLIRQVVEFHDRVVREVMTPRTEIASLPAEATIREARDRMLASRHSRLPVYRGQIDNIEGLVHMRDLVACWGTTEESGPVAPLARPALFVPETQQVSALLREMQARRTKIALVVDEYGGIAGLVTLEDLVEEIVGEIREEHERDEREVAPEGEGRYLVRGSAAIEALNAALGTDVPAEGFDTVAGLIYSHLGRIPRAGEVVQLGDVRLEVVKADSRRINLVRAVRGASTSAPAAP